MSQSLPSNVFFLFCLHTALLVCPPSKTKGGGQCWSCFVLCVVQPQKSNIKKPNLPPKEVTDSVYCGEFIKLTAQKHFWHLHQLLSAQSMLIPSADPSPNCAFVRHEIKWWDGGVTFSGISLSAEPDLSSLEQTEAGQGPEEEEY